MDRYIREKGSKYGAFVDQLERKLEFVGKRARPAAVGGKEEEKRPDPL